MSELTNNPIGSSDESGERALNRHRASEQRSTREDVLGRLRDRGIELDDGDSDETVVELLEAVEAFERSAEAQGADLMVDTPPSRQPDDPRFVLPRKQGGESTVAYTARVRSAAARLGSGIAD
jgi:hypothetical protein